jgi:hypothetical protein
MFMPSLILIATVAGQSPGAGKAVDERLDFMKSEVGGYRLAMPDDRGKPFRLKTEPVFRLGKQNSDNVTDGAIFLWTDDDGRPAAAVQAFQIRDSYYPNGLWIHEFTSLSRTPLIAERDGQAVWRPTKAGVQFERLNDADAPAATAVLRTRQMNDFARRFRAADDFKKKGWSDLRLLAKPLYRYGGEKSSVIDGAVFAFVLGTDTEVLLILEATPGKDSNQWHYALAPMSVFALKCSYQGASVWEVPDRMPAEHPSLPFFALARP